MWLRIKLDLFEKLERRQIADAQLLVYLHLVQFCALQRYEYRWDRKYSYTLTQLNVGFVTITECFIISSIVFEMSGDKSQLMIHMDDFELYKLELFQRLCLYDRIGTIQTNNQ